MTTADDVFTCAACQVLDAGDGSVDGSFIAQLPKRVPHESKIVEALKETEDRVADKITAFAGSMNFVYLHSVWFLIWVLLNVGAVGASIEFDKFPFGLLTMVVSLEAIFLATFVMVSQNRQAARADIRAQLDFETNIRAEVWAVHIGQKIGVDPGHVEALVKKAIEESRRTG